MNDMEFMHAWVHGWGFKGSKSWGGGVRCGGFEIVHSTDKKKALNLLSLRLGAMPHRIAIVCTIACSGWCSDGTSHCQPGQFSLWLGARGPP